MTAKVGFSDDQPLRSTIICVHRDRYSTHITQAAIHHTFPVNRVEIRKLRFFVQTSYPQCTYSAHPSNPLTHSPTLLPHPISPARPSQLAHTISCSLFLTNQ
ncbi:unnamed protein product [Calicophoron daubneyi]|uniref:Uncharacterized protein n=1 Tax=Calicophoron daubneyi TaxID=300641 RepID=A0AAV2TTN8_CALDB